MYHIWPINGEPPQNSLWCVAETLRNHKGTLPPCWIWCFYPCFLFNDDFFVFVNCMYKYIPRRCSRGTESVYLQGFNGVQYAYERHVGRHHITIAVGGDALYLTDVLSDVALKHMRENARSGAHAPCNVFAYLVYVHYTRTSSASCIWYIIP